MQYVSLVQIKDMSYITLRHFVINLLHKFPLQCIYRPIKFCNCYINSNCLQHHQLRQQYQFILPYIPTLSYTTVIILWYSNADSDTALLYHRIITVVYGVLITKSCCICSYAFRTQGRML